MKLSRAALFMVLTMLVAACLPSSRVRDVIPVDSAATLHPGDSLRVAVWRNPELSGGFLVAEDGTLRHPLYQAVHVVGVPIDTVRARVGAFLTQFTTDPQFVVEPEFHIVVRGEVRSPALYTVPLETTLGGAIAVSGGPTESAQLRNVTLVRAGRSYHLDLTDPAAPWTATPIRSGDQIIVGRKTNLFFGMILPLVTASAAVASLISVLRRN
jgi:protein involved in polysaccharide export with SLBB domain